MSDYGQGYEPQKPQKAAKRKKPITKKWWFWVIIGMFVIYIIAPKQSEEPASSENQSQEAEVTETPTPTVAPTPALETTEPSATSPEDIVSTVDAIVGAGFDDANRKTELDETTKIVMVSVWEDGITAEAMIAADGNEEYKEGWQTVRDGIASISESIASRIQEEGFPDYHCAINVLNDVNKDMVLLSVLDGVIMYDAVEEDGFLN